MREHQAEEFAAWLTIPEAEALWLAYIPPEGRPDDIE